MSDGDTLPSQLSGQPNAQSDTRQDIIEAEKIRVFRTIQPRARGTRTIDQTSFGGRRSRSQASAVGGEHIHSECAPYGVYSGVTSPHRTRVSSASWLAFEPTFNVPEPIPLSYFLTSPAPSPMNRSRLCQWCDLRNWCRRC